jgi:hypothetical protein
MAKLSVLGRAAARGLTAAMMMTGARELTMNLGLLEESPPEAVVRRGAPRQAKQLSPGTRAAMTELAHWAYGTAGGIVYGMLPARIRSHPASGPVYGLVIWLGFELGLAPVLGIQHAHGKVAGRLMLVADHTLYGVVVSGRLAPEPEATSRKRT